MKDSDLIEESFNQSDTMFRLIIENSYAGIYILGGSGKFVFVNDRFCQIFGYLRNELIGIEFCSLFDEENSKEIFDIYSQRQDCPNTASFSEVMCRHKDGSRIYLESSFSLVKDPSGSNRTLGQVFDITTHKTAEISLMESEALNRSLLDATSAGVVLLEKGKITKTNNAISKISGYSREQLVGQSLRKFYIDEAEFLTVDKKLHEQMMSNGLGYAEARFKKKDDDNIYVMLGLSPLDPNNMGRGLTLTVLDITERKEAEYELQRIKYAIDSTTDAIGMSTADGKHFYQNKAFDKMFGYTVEEFAKKHPVIAYNDTDIGQEVFDHIMSGKSWQGEVEMRAKNGRIIPILLRADSVRDAGGEVVTLIGVHTDMSGHKQAEEQLKQSEEKYRNIFENAIEGIFQSSLDGNLISVNPAMARIAGYESTSDMLKAVGNYVNDIYVHPEDRVQALNILRKNGVLHSFEFEAYNMNKEKLWVSLNARLIKDSNGEVSHIEGTIFDITDRKKAESERSHLENILQHLQKIESIGRLAGGVAHDFNNLLTAIMGNTEMAMMMLEPETKPHKLLTTVTKAAEGAAKLTRQLLVFSRKQVIEPKVVNINDLIEHVVNMLLTIIGENITLKIFPFENLHAIYADPGQLEQIIINLAANARDSMPDGGICTITTGNKYFSETDLLDHPNVRSGDYAMIALSDTGCGMSREIMNHLYEPFYTTKDKGKGTGLGLATVYGIVQQNGGIIEVKSVVNKGTTFEVYFPKTTEQSADASISKIINEVPLGDETVLLVEDNEHVLQYTSNALKNLGYKVVLAASGEEALEIVATYQGKIDLLMTDVILPGMNGRAVAHAISQRIAGIKVLYHSGYTDEVIDKHGILEEGLNFLSKPFTIGTLALKVREVLDKDS